MTLSPGTQFGPYEIADEIGAGGMGVVYRATDTKLDREVAIKTLPSTLAADTDRLARFEREAKLLAALNHPNIAVIYDLDEHEGTKFIAMELIEGETLEEKLKEGPLPVEDALRLALQIAQALEAAHEKGVVHRDLKPANVMVTGKGQVKVLDFGLAKAFSEDPDASLGHSPALSLAMTQQGIVLGTASYMSPEQASGQTTDQRADVWAFGVVLFEMLSGLPLFTGESVPHIMAAVLQLEPDWNRLPKNLHPRLKLLLERCLEKKVRNRYHAIADARIDIEKVLSDPEGLQAYIDASAVTAGRPVLPWVAASAVLTVALAGVLVWSLQPTPEPEPQPVNRFDYELPEAQVFRGTGRPVIEVSPDGRWFVYNSQNGLYLRAMGELEARIIPGTEEEGRSPVFSPGSESVAYYVDGQLKRIAISGGAPVVIGPSETNVNGLSWEADGTILFGQPDGIYRVSATGGTPEHIIPIEDGTRIYGPRLLPDGDSVLFSVGTVGDWDAAQIVVQSLSTGERAVIVEGGSDARYLPTGHIVYALNDGLFAVVFDLDTLTPSGGAVPLVQGVMRAANGITGAANYGVSEDGTLVYVAGSTVNFISTLLWTDREGREESLMLEPQDYNQVSVSPDGSRLAFSIEDVRGSTDVWTYNLASGIPTRLTFEPGIDDYPLWTPDSQRIVYFSDRDGGGLFWQEADGTGQVERLTTTADREVHVPTSFLADGSELIYFTQGGGIAFSDLYALSMDEERTPRLILESEFDEDGADVSPNGRWIAYTTDESGQDEIYVRPYPNIDDGKWQVSRGGGASALWGPDGQELFYRVFNTFEFSTLMVLSIEDEPSFSFGLPEELFMWDAVGGSYGYDVAPDGQRFMVNRQGASVEATLQIIVVQNWFEELNRLASRPE